MGTFAALSALATGVRTNRRLVVVSGASGSGKSTHIIKVRDVIAEKHGVIIPIVKSTTSRARRPGDPNEDVFYSFVQTDQFSKMLSDGKMLTHSNYAGINYGFNSEDILSSLNGNPVAITSATEDGVCKLRQKGIDVFAILLLSKWACPNGLSHEEKRRREAADQLRRQQENIFDLVLEVKENPAGYDPEIVEKIAECVMC